MEIFFNLLGFFEKKIPKHPINLAVHIKEWKRPTQKISGYTPDAMYIIDRLHLNRWFQITQVSEKINFPTKISNKERSKICKIIFHPINFCHEIFNIIKLFSRWHEENHSMKITRNSTNMNEYFPIDKVSFHQYFFRIKFTLLKIKYPLNCNFHIKLLTNNLSF